MNSKIIKIFEKRSGVMCSVRKLNHYHLLSRVLELNLDGDVVECGCFVGNSAQMLAAVIEYYESNKTLHLYDSFQGLSELHENDIVENGKFKKGSFSATQNQLINNLKPYSICKKIYPGWFEQSIPENLPEKICYAHLDSDLYEPLSYCLKHVYERLVSGGICVVDDYDYDSFPGAKKAVNEFLSDKKEKIHSFCIKPEFHKVYHAYFKKI